MLENIPEITDKYEVLDKMAEGGMVSIYRVRHKILDEVRVIKTILPEKIEEEGFLARFLHEARVAAKVRHPNIAALHDCSVSDDGTPYMVMEFIDGTNLRDYLRSGFAFNPDQVREIATQALAALDQLHSEGIVHRDISSDNLMISEDKNGELTVKLIDLGLAKSLHQEDWKTQTGFVMGKALYVAPEQLRFGSSVLDARSDLYSLGVLLYELLTRGESPIEGDDQISMIAGHLHEPPKSFDRTDPQGLVPSAMRAVVMKALEKEPEDRHQSAAEFSQALVMIELESSGEGLLDPTKKMEAGALPSAKQRRGAETRTEATTVEEADDSSKERTVWANERLAMLLAAAVLPLLLLGVWLFQGSVGDEVSSDEAAATDPVVSRAAFGEFYALVVGIDRYQQLQPLQTAVNDARAIAEVLERRYGFKVTLLENPVRSELASAIYDIADRVTARDSLLLYYAGHGVLIRESEYWQPADSAPDDTGQWISTRHEVTDALDGSRAKHVLVISDSCFAGVDEGAELDFASADLEQLVKRSSRLVLASGSLSPVLDQGEGINSVFANSLLELLRSDSPMLGVGELFDELRITLPERAAAFGAEQIPSLAAIPGTTDSGGGFFFFRGP